MTSRIQERKTVLLGKADIFSSLSDTERSVIARSTVYRDFKRDEPVFSPGEPGNRLYIVESGEVLVQKQDESGRTTDIARFVEGSVFGELDLFSQTERSVRALASENTRLLEFPSGADSHGGNEFGAFLEAQPELSARILHKILVEIAGRIRRANALIKENSPLIQELKKQVYRDKSTGLYNQTYLTEQLRKLSETGEPGFALIITKPDNFKELNDSLGHEAGDKAIRLMGQGLRKFIGDDERTARYRGNAMAVVLTGGTREQALELAQRILGFMEKLDLSDVTGGEPFHVTASAGVSLFPRHGRNAETLISDTHELTLAARYRGGGKVLFPEDIE